MGCCKRRPWIRKVQYHWLICDCFNGDDGVCIENWCWGIIMSKVIAFCDVNARRFFILEREGTVHCKRKLEHVGEEWEKGF